MAKALTERSKPSRGAGARDGQDAGNPRRQRLWRDLALIVIAPLLLYLWICLFTYSPDDPGWSTASGGVTSVSLTGTILTSHVGNVVNTARVHPGPTTDPDYEAMKRLRDLVGSI